MWSKILAVLSFLKSVWEFFYSDKVKIKNLKARINELDGKMHKATAAGDDYLFNTLYSERMSAKTELDSLLHK